MLFHRIRLVYTEYRELLLTLAIKNLKLQYKYAILGFLWSLFHPFCQMLVFWFIFGFLFGGVRSIGPLFLISALFPYMFFQTSVMGGTGSLLDNAPIIKKVYFPREIVPFSLVLSNMINFLLSLTVLIGMVILKNLVRGQPPLQLGVCLLPYVLLLTVLFTAGITLFVSVLQVYFRDVRYIVDIVLMLWFYLSGVFFDPSLVINSSIAKKFPFIVDIYMMNPITSLFTMYRAMFLDTKRFLSYYPPLRMFGTCTLISVGVFLCGYWFFLRKERDVVDLIGT